MNLPSSRCFPQYFPCIGVSRLTFVASQFVVHDIGMLTPLSLFVFGCNYVINTSSSVTVAIKECYPYPLNKIYIFFFNGISTTSRRLSVNASKPMRLGSNGDCLWTDIRTLSKDRINCRLVNSSSVGLHVHMYWQNMNAFASLTTSEYRSFAWELQTKKTPLSFRAIYRVAFVLRIP